MDSMRFRFALPATLIVTTVLCASACKDQNSTDGSSDSGHVPDYCIDIEMQAVCESEPGCAWDQQNGYCLNVCYMITDQAECEAIEKCEWYAEGEEQSGTETGDSAYCDEPFT
jgi:hypothetical protein